MGSYEDEVMRHVRREEILAEKINSETAAKERAEQQRQREQQALIDELDKLTLPLREEADDRISRAAINAAELLMKYKVRADNRLSFKPRRWIYAKHYAYREYLKGRDVVEGSNELESESAFDTKGTLYYASRNSHGLGRFETRTALADDVGILVSTCGEPLLVENVELIIETRLKEIEKIDQFVVKAITNARNA
jgi:hypothetical protein